MKVVHISTYEGGGAGIAARRLHENLLTEGIDSRFLCAFPSYKAFNIIKVEEKPLPWWKRSLREASLYNLAIDIEKKRIKNIGGEYDHFSSPNSNYRVEEHYHLYDADIVHLHWISDFIDYPTFFINQKLPIVITQHDMNSFMGGYHYKLDIENNSGNEKLNQMNLKYLSVKKEALKSVSKMQIVSPSNWMKENSLASEVLGKYNHQVIPYGINCSIFKAYPQDFCRTIFDFPRDKKIILFVCDNLENKRKGFDLLMETVKSLQASEDLCFVAVGQLNVPLKLDGLITLGRITDERVMSFLFNAADALVIPSRVDNLPNVMLEALCCGCPVIGFPVGGISETIVSGMNGIIASDVSAGALVAVIQHFLQCDEFDREKIRREARNKYEIKIQSLSYISLYEKMLGQSS